MEVSGLPFSSSQDCTAITTILLCCSICPWWPQNIFIDIRLNILMLKRGNKEPQSSDLFQRHPISCQKWPRRKSSESYSRMLYSSLPCVSHQPHNSPSKNAPSDTTPRQLRGQAFGWENRYSEVAGKRCCAGVYTSLYLLQIKYEPHGRYYSEISLQH